MSLSSPPLTHSPPIRPPHNPTPYPPTALPMPPQQQQQQQYYQQQYAPPPAPKEGTSPVLLVGAGVVLAVGGMKAMVRGWGG
jgi:hypothetical protein